MKCINFLFVSFIFAEIVDWPRANKFWRLTSDRRKPTYHTSLPSGSPPNLYPADQHRQLAGPRDLRSRIANGQSFPASSPILQLRGTVARHRAAAATAESPPNAQTESGSLLDRSSCRNRLALRHSRGTRSSSSRPPGLGFQATSPPPHSSSMAAFSDCTSILKRTAKGHSS